MEQLFVLHTMAASPAAPPSSSSSPELVARAAELAWYKGEFAAANAIIDALCYHLTRIAGAPGQYEPVFAAIGRRRCHWLPALQMQEYFPISEVAVELRHVADARKGSAARHECAGVESGCDVTVEEEGGTKEQSVDIAEGGCSSDSLGCREETLISLSLGIIPNGEMNGDRSSRLKMTKGFIAKELVEGHMVNVVKGLKLYEDFFSDLDIFKLCDCVNKLRLAGQKGELSGETFILLNKEAKENKREIIQLGTSMFQPIKNSGTSSIEPIPSSVQAIVDELIRYRLVPERAKPNSCIINFFEEGEYSQPYVKPPHFDHPVSTLLLSESTMAFGWTLVGDEDGNFKGPLMLSLKQGSLLVMRGNSAAIARHAMCSSPNKRISITFFKVQTPPSTDGLPHPTNIPISTTTKALSQPRHPYPHPNHYHKLPSAMFWQQSVGAVLPDMGLINGAAPIVLMEQTTPPATSVTSIREKSLVPSTGGGTGMFLPWTSGHRKWAKEKRVKFVPPRFRRLSQLPRSSSFPTNTNAVQPSPDSSDSTVTE